MKLLEVTGTDAIEMLADLIDPVSDLLSDPQVLKCLQTDQKLKAVKFMLKNNAKTVLKIMAICEGVPIAEYKPTITELPAKLLEIMNHPDIAKLFFTQEQIEASSSGTATEVTTAQEM